MSSQNKCNPYCNASLNKHKELKHFCDCVHRLFQKWTSTFLHSYPDNFCLFLILLPNQVSQDGKSDKLKKMKISFCLNIMLTPELHCFICQLFHISLPPPCLTLLVWLCMINVHIYSGDLPIYLDPRPLVTHADNNSSSTHLPITASFIKWKGCHQILSLLFFFLLKALQNNDCLVE